ncbi:hypothetical protein KUV85_03900 [Nocardioides panacisoli]|uniref:DUF6325 family protein n=1 Tax=Nocardioides panacisoli TaxID=627624 RepID=UPI001C63300F|nr:DUF6325 family protein [Nocardioides panacisoli]QYJ04837.1 hypothetical protein KUV85_03900 [Nocardioides panacisoli]
MSRGPIEVLLLAFPADVPAGDLLEHLRGPVAAAQLRVVDLVLVGVEEAGNRTFRDLEDGNPGELAAGLDLDPHTLLNEDDVESLASALGPEQQGAVVVVEHLWATGLAEGLRGLGAELALHVRVTPEEAEAAFAATGAWGRPA